MPLELSGMDALLARLQRIGGNVEQVQGKALKKGAEVIRQEMSNNAPVGVKRPNTWQYKAGKKYATEHLKDNIIIGKVKGRTARYVNVGPEKSFFAARFIELGTVKLSAKPFMEPAYLAKRGEALVVMADEIREAIESG